MQKLKDFVVYLPIIISIFFLEFRLSFERPWYVMVSLPILFLVAVRFILKWKASPFAVPRKSLVAGYLSAVIALMLIYLTVVSNFWSGFYVDFDVARTIFTLLVIAAPLSIVLARVLKSHVSSSQIVFVAVVTSLVCSLHFLLYRIYDFQFASFSLLVWVTGSLLAIHFVLGFLLLRRLLPDGFIGSRVYQISSIPLRTLSVVQFLVFIVISVHIEASYAPKDRAKGPFAIPAAHLQNFEPGRKINSALDERKANQFTVLNLNVWDVEGWIPAFLVSPSKDVDQRLSLLPKEIAQLSPDIIIFQEMWKHKRRVQMAADLKHLGYPHHVHGSDSLMSHLGVGNGLLIVSKFPLDKEVRYLTFTRATRVDEGPIFARKGVIKTRAEVEAGKWIDLYASHLGGFSTTLDSSRKPAFVVSEQKAKLDQTRELVRFVKETRTPGSPVILGTDLNTHLHPLENGEYALNKFAPEYELITCTFHDDCGKLTDSASVVHHSNRHELHTYDTVNNFYASSGHFNIEPPGILDYIFVSPDLKPLSSERVFTENPLSDHYGLLSRFSY